MKIIYFYLFVGNKRKCVKAIHLSENGAKYGVAEKSSKPMQLMMVNIEINKIKLINHWFSYVIKP